MVPEAKPILTQLELTTDRKVHEEATIQILEKIGVEVHEICCFGSNNSGKAKELSTHYNERMKLFALLLTNPKMFKRKDREKIQSLLNSVFEITTRTDLEKHFKLVLCEGNKICFINPASLSRLFHALPPDLEYTQNDIAPLISQIALLWAKHIMSSDVFFGDKEKRDIIKTGIDRLQSGKTESTDPNVRLKVIQSIIHDVKHSAFYFGSGNCQIMAELAFLLAIQKTKNIPIRYIQFSHQQGAREELNAIVLGDWPKPGCIILAPWKSKTPFIWKGKYENTDYLQFYNQENVFFSIQNEKERAEWVEVLKDNGFDPSTLMKNENRQNYLPYILKISEKCLQKPKNKNAASTK